MAPSLAPSPATADRLACRVTALASVSEATWSITTRTRPASSVAAAQSSANGRSRASRPALESASTSSASSLRCRSITADPVLRAHHVVGRDRLQHRDLQQRPIGTTSIGLVAHERTRDGGERRLLHAPQNRPIRSLVRFFSAARETRAPVVRRRRASCRSAAGRPSTSLTRAWSASGTYHSRRVSPSALDVEPGRGRPARPPRRPRRRGPSRRRRRRDPSPAPPGSARRRPARPQPPEDRQVVVVDAELRSRDRRSTPRRRRRGQGYFVQASSVARVRLSPTDLPSRRGSSPPAGSGCATSGRCPRSLRTPRSSSASTRSPLCPNGGWPRSCASAAVSTRSGWQPSARARSRATWATSREWVSRLRTKSSVCGPKTWVLAASRRDAAAWTTRARSRSNGGARERPPLRWLRHDALAGRVVVQIAPAHGRHVRAWNPRISAPPG